MRSLTICILTVGLLVIAEARSARHHLLSVVKARQTPKCTPQAKRECITNSKLEIPQGIDVLDLMKSLEESGETVEKDPSGAARLLRSLLEKATGASSSDEDGGKTSDEKNPSGAARLLRSLLEKATGAGSSDEEGGTTSGDKNPSGAARLLRSLLKKSTSNVRHGHRYARSASGEDDAEFCKILEKNGAEKVKKLGECINKVCPTIPAIDDAMLAAASCPKAAPKRSANNLQRVMKELGKLL